MEKTNCSICLITLTHSFADNHLYGTIPSEYGAKLSLLRLFQVNQNDLTGTLPQWLIGTELDENIETEPTSTRSKLEYVVLFYNKLTGSIPTSISLHGSIKWLFLSGNMLTGTIPEELFDGTNKTFDISQIAFDSNMLSGTIPTSIGNLSNLNLCAFSSNQLEGPLPSEVGGLVNLEFLVLRETGISGKHASCFAFCGSAAYCLLSLYDFMACPAVPGTLPTELGNLSELVSLWLWGNNLNGTIPSQLFDGQIRRKISDIVLHENELTGTLPHEAMMAATNLVHLYLGSNQLSGTIPSTLLYMTSLGNSNS